MEPQYWEDWKPPDWTDRSAILELVSQNGLTLQFASRALQEDRIVVLAAVQENGNALRFAASILKADRTVVLEAVRQTGLALAHAASELAADREIVLEAVKQDAQALKHAAPEVKGDRKFFAEAVKHNWRVLVHAGPELTADRELVLEAVKRNGFALVCAAHTLRADRDIVQTAVGNAPSALEFAANDLRADPEFMLNVLRKDPSNDRVILALSAEALRDNCDFVLRLWREGFADFDFADPNLWTNRNFLMEAVPIDWKALWYADIDWEIIQDVVLEAVCRCWEAIRSVPGEQVSLLCRVEAVHQNWNAFDHFVLFAVAEDYLSDEPIGQYWPSGIGFGLDPDKFESELQKEIALERLIEIELQKLVKANPRIIQHNFLRNRKSVVLTAVKQNGLALQYAADVLRGDKDVVLAAVQQNGVSLGHASPSLRCDPDVIAMCATLTENDAVETLPATQANNGSSICKDYMAPFAQQVGNIFCSIAYSTPLQRLAHAISVHISVEQVLDARRKCSQLNTPTKLPQILSERLLLEHSRVFSLRHNDYGLRGGKPYYKPRGWARFAVHADIPVLADWPVAYHGTTLSKALMILAEGLQRPGCEDEIAHGQAYSSTRQSIYVSPSVEYAAHPVYSAFADFGPGAWIQAVLQLRVCPNKFAVYRGSLGNKHWPMEVRMDPNFPTLEGLEWLIEDPSDIVIVGVLVREFGHEADVSLFGDSAARVTHGGQGPEYEWTRLRAEEFRERGLFLEA